MAIKIDDEWLAKLGLGKLPQAEKTQLLEHVYETLELRVGTKIAAILTDAQLKDFEQFIDTNDQAGAMKWLETNYPAYPQVVSEELDKLKSEIKKDSAKILAAAKPDHKAK